MKASLHLKIAFTITYCIFGLGLGTVFLPRVTHCPPPHTEDGQQLCLSGQSKSSIHSLRSVVNAHESGSTVGTVMRHLEKLNYRIFQLSNRSFIVVCGCCVAE